MLRRRAVAERAPTAVLELVHDDDRPRRGFDLESYAVRAIALHANRWRGEKKTLRMVAQYADESNLTGAVEDIPRKLEALAAHCERLGRDRTEVKVAKLLMVAVAPTLDELEADLEEIATAKGWNDAIMGAVRQALIYGDADTVDERIAGAVALGLDGVTVDLPLNGHKTERIELLAKLAVEALGKEGDQSGVA